MQKKIGVFFFLFLVINLYAEKTRDLGQYKVLQSSKCSFSGSFIKGKDYDVSDVIQYANVKTVKKNVLQFTLELEKGNVDNYIQIAYYHKNQEKKYNIYPDLTHETPKEVTRSATGIFFLVEKKGLYPVVYQKGERGLNEEKKQLFLDPFIGEKTVTTTDGNVVGGHGGGILTYFMVKALGSGAKEVNLKKKSMILMNEKRQYVFYVNFNPKITDNNWYFIISIPRITIVPSGRGLRSSIITTMINISGNCKAS